VAGIPRHTSSRPKGWSIVTTPDGRSEECDTQMCVHCGKHWRVQPGSGKVRGYCFKCMGPICGPKCVECYPREKQIEDMTKSPGGILLP